MVAASPFCWARRIMTNPPTASAKTSTRTAPASCLAQLFIRPNNGGALEKVRQTLAQEPGAAGVVVGGKQRPHPGLGKGDQRLNGLTVALDGLANYEADGLSQPEIFGPGQCHRQHRDVVLGREVGKAFFEGQELTFL